MDLDAPLGAVAVKFDSLFAEVADAENYAEEAGLFGEADLVREERRAGDLDDERGNFLRDRAQALGETTGEDGNGQGDHGDECDVEGTSNQAFRGPSGTITLMAW